MADQLIPPGDAPQIRDAARRLEQPIHAERHMRIICVGAGASGLLFAYKMQKHFRNFTLVVYEKNPAVSGTWFENRYPGCACDVPSHNYTWSFEPKPDWPAVYPPAKDIFDYFESFATKYDLRQYVRLQHQVVGAYWNHARGGYDVEVQDQTAAAAAAAAVVRDHCDILINASGILNHWRWPAIPGLDTYEGTLLHTANWDPAADLDGKHVGLIGNGSSGIQVLPAIRARCRRVTTFVREPTWVSPVRGLEQHTYTAAERAAFAGTPGALLQYRKTIETGLNGQFPIFLKGSTVSERTRAYMEQQMRDKIGRADLAALLVPDWAVGCRRLTPGVGYLEALTAPNVEVVYGEIGAVTARGPRSAADGREHPVDVLICATGFDTSFRPRFPVVTPAGTNLQDQWAVDPAAYLGVAAAGVPNYLVFLGPNCPIGNGPVLSAIEAQADWMCQLIDRFQTTNMATFAPTAAAVRDFVAFKDHYMRRTVWQDPCRSWYKSRPDGPVLALWPGSTLHYIEAVRELRLDDFDVTYTGNRFAWLGNGFSQTEVDHSADWAYYVREADDGPPLSTRGRLHRLNKSGTVTERRAVDWSGVIDMDEAIKPRESHL